MRRLVQKGKKNLRPYNSWSCTIPFTSSKVLLIGFLLVENDFRFLWLEVSIVEEVGEEEQIAGVHGRATGQVEVRLVARQLALLGREDEIVDHDTHHHLEYLERGDADADKPRNGHPESLEGIVGVHEGMDDVVHDHKPATGSSMVSVAVPDIDHDTDVMVPVEENERLLG